MKYFIEYKKEKNYVYVKTEGFLKLEEYKEAWQNIFETCQATDCYYVLVDDRKNKIVLPENQEWFLTSMLPKLQVLSNIWYFAQVMSEDIFSQVTSEQITEAMPDNTSVEIFLSLEEAEKTITTYSMKE